MTILLRMDDKMNRQLSCDVTENDTASDLTQELVRLGFVHIDDQDKIQALLEETLRSTFSEGGAAFGEFGAQERTFSATINEQNATSNAISNNNNINSNNNTVMITKSLPANPSMTSLNQMERNWSIADSDAAAATASLMLQAQGQTQQIPPTALASPMLPSSTVAVPILDPLAGHVIYVPHEQLQQEQQQQQILQHQHSPPQLHQQHHIDPSMVSVDVVDTTSSYHHQQQQHINPAEIASSITAPHLSNLSASPLPTAIPTNAATSTSSTPTPN